MNKWFKKMIVGVTAATLMLGSVCTAYAATGSATTAPQPEKQKEVTVDASTSKKSDVSEVNTSSKGTATVTAVKETTKKSVSVASTVKVDGVTYTVTRIEAKTFENATKATKVSLPTTITSIGAKAFTGMSSTVKTIVIKSTDTVKVNKTAFKGVDTSKMTIKVTNMSKSEYKAFVKQLKKAGYKGKVKYKSSKSTKLS